MKNKNTKDRIKRDPATLDPKRKHSSSHVVSGNRSQRERQRIAFSMKTGKKKASIFGY